MAKKPNTPETLATVKAKLLPVVQDLCAANAQLLKHYDARDNGTQFVGSVLDKSQRAAGNLFQLLNLIDATN